MTKLMLAVAAVAATSALPLSIPSADPHSGAALTQLGLALIIGFAIGWARTGTNRANSSLKMAATILGALVLSGLYEALHRPLFLAPVIDPVMLPLTGAVTGLILSDLLERCT